MSYSHPQFETPTHSKFILVTLGSFRLVQNWSTILLHIAFCFHCGQTHCLSFCTWFRQCVKQEHLWLFWFHSCLCARKQKNQSMHEMCVWSSQCTVACVLFRVCRHAKSWRMTLASLLESLCLSEYVCCQIFFYMFRRNMLLNIVPARFWQLPNRQHENLCYIKLCPRAKPLYAHFSVSDFKT